MLFTIHNTKLQKSEKFGYKSVGLSLLPHRLADEKIDLIPGQLIFLDSSSKILFKTISDGLTMLSFNISPLEYLYRQYYQKWIPLA